MTQNLWGGRFAQAADAEFARYNASLSFDQRLFQDDITGSLAYASALHQAGILDSAEVSAIREGLQAILLDLQADPALLRHAVEAGAEDIHSFIEAELVRRIGEIGYKLHTGRSRNDQVATDLRLFLRREILHLRQRLLSLTHALLQRATDDLGLPWPGYTHLQKAQPVLFSHYLLAYVEMFRRDLQRLDETYQRTNVLPLGSGAIAGCNYPLDRHALASDLGFDSISRNSMDAVSDRDFVLDALYASSTIMIHLSRLAEDLILYSSKEFGLIEMSDRVSTGSSLMPQKKNPDALELIRGKTGRVLGHLLGLLTVSKGLPLTYNKDLQEDKEALFDTLDTLLPSLGVMTTVVSSFHIHRTRLADALQRDFLNATEVADYLVRKGLPFRKAHRIVGQLVLHAIAQGSELHTLPLHDFQALSPLFQPDLFDCLSLDSTLAAKALPGGTSPSRVREALSEASLALGFRYPLPHPPMSHSSGESGS